MFRVRRLFLAAAALLYVGFLVLDLTRAADSAPLKFAAISLCFAAALPGARTADGSMYSCLDMVFAPLNGQTPAGHFAASSNSQMTSRRISLTVGCGKISSLTSRTRSSVSIISAAPQMISLA